MLGSKQIMKAYAARNYDKKNPRDTNYVEVYVPEYMPTLPRDNKSTRISLPRGYFANSNYPVTQSIVELSHALTLPLARGTVCPTQFSKGDTFLIVLPTTKIEEGYLIYL